MKAVTGRLILRGWAPLALCLLIALPACKRTSPRPASVDSAMTEKPDSNADASARTAAIIAAHAARLMAVPGVHGVAEGRTKDGRPCILLLVEDPNAPEVRALPTELEGFPVRFDVSDSIRAFGRKKP